MRLHRLLTSLAAVSLLAAGCNDQDGRELPLPDGVPESEPFVLDPDAEEEPADDAFRLASPAVQDGGQLPVQHTCHGEGFSVPLGWSGTPAAHELAIVVREPDAGGLVHWLVTGIDPTVQGFGEGGVPEGAVEWPNDAGGTGWAPPCPAEGTATYVIGLLVLPDPVELSGEAAPGDLATLVEGMATDRAELTVTAAAP